MQHLWWSRGDQGSQGPKWPGDTSAHTARHLTVSQRRLHSPGSQCRWLGFMQMCNLRGMHWSWAPAVHINTHKPLANKQPSWCHTLSIWRLEVSFLEQTQCKCSVTRGKGVSSPRSFLKIYIYPSSLKSGHILQIHLFYLILMNNLHCRLSLKTSKLRMSTYGINTKCNITQTSFRLQ